MHISSTYIHGLNMPTRIKVGIQSKVRQSHIVIGAKFQMKGYCHLELERLQIRILMY